jgi:hypothetical protein
MQAMTQELAGNGQGLEKLRRRLREVRTTANFPAFAAAFDGLTGKKLLDVLADRLLQVPLTSSASVVIQQKSKDLPLERNQHTEALAYSLQLISLPEYQLC